MCRDGRSDFNSESTKTYTYTNKVAASQQPQCVTTTQPVIQMSVDCANHTKQIKAVCMSNKVVYIVTAAFKLAGAQYRTRMRLFYL